MVPACASGRAYRSAESDPVTPCRPEPEARLGHQVVTIYDGVIWTLTGKRGTLTIRDRNEWVEVETGEDAVGIGTWKVVRGTCQYAGVGGNGSNGHAGLGNPWYARYERFLTAS